MSKTTIWACGFCNVGNHDGCTGAAINQGKILRCSCGTHPLAPRCLECGNRRPEELDGWACRNPSDCADAIAARSAANPLRPMLEEVYVLAGEARRRALHERTVRQILAAVAECRIDDELGHDVAADLSRPRRPRKPRVARPAEGTCICGCEGPTKGGRFQPGHDARLKSQLKQAASAGDASAVERLVALGWERYVPADAPVQLSAAS